MSADPDAVVLVVRRRCDVCAGTAQVRTDEWEAFFAASPDNRVSVEQFFLDQLGLEAIPPRERECGACDQGFVDGEMPLEDVVSIVMDRVPTSIIPRAELETVVRSLQRTITEAAARSQGLADADDVGSWLRAVQEGAEALRSISEVLVRRSAA